MEQEPAPNHAGSRPHTRNERLIVELPLSAVEVRQRDRCMMFHMGKTQGSLQGAMFAAG